MDSFEAALALVPGHPDLLQALGKTLLSQQRPEAAAERFCQVVEAVPDHVEAWQGLGTVLMASGDFTGAAAALAEACKYRPQDTELAVDRGVALTRSIACSISASCRW